MHCNEVENSNVTALYFTCTLFYMPEQRITYTPWGQHNLTTDNTATGKFLFDRGFSGHEHLDQFKLINMNGRIYDPALGVMLSPDNFVQNPESTQGLNRYTYCLNNPMVYRDPSGELIPIWIIPNISVSPQGGITFSVTIGVGLPGVAFAGVTIGGSTNSSYFASVGGNLGPFSGSVGWHLNAGFNASLSFGIPYPGISIGNNFAVNSNVTSIVVSYSQYGGFSANAFGFNYSFNNNRLSFDPSIGISYSSNAGFLGKRNYIRNNYPKAIDEQNLKNTRIRTKNDFMVNGKKAYGYFEEIKDYNTPTGEPRIIHRLTLDRTMVMDEYLGKSSEFENTIYHEGKHGDDYFNGIRREAIANMSKSRANSYLEIRAYDAQPSWTINDYNNYMEHLHNYLFGK